MQNRTAVVGVLACLAGLAACAATEPEIREITEDQSTIRIDRKLISVQTGLVPPSASHLSAADSQTGSSMNMAVVQGQDIIGEIVALRAGAGYVYAGQSITSVVEPTWLEEDQEIAWYGVQQSTGTGFGMAQFRPFRIAGELDCVGFMAAAGPADDAGQRTRQYHGYFCVIEPETMTPRRAQVFLDSLSFTR